MWQKLVLTAGSDAQNRIFHEQIFSIPTGKFCEGIEIVTDESPGVRIGSGGATLSIIRRVLQDVKERENVKILLIHSGGLSQRMPHLSAYGKVFSMLPNGKTLLETKLEIYKKDLLNKLPAAGGIMISASDVLENMSYLLRTSDASDVLIFAHPSSLEVGTQHGVFVMDENENQLKKVLQKPSVEEMKREEAVRTDGTVLTDSCYFMTWKFCERLLENNLLREPVTEELCCYGDFMRPMGSEPKLDYIESTSSKLTSYRKALADVFKTAKTEISILGANSFFHFGTYHEFLDHLLPDSQFRRSFPMLFDSNVIHSKLQNVPETSFAEFCTGTRLEVGSRCLISGVDSEDLKLRVPNDTVIFTLALKSKMYVSIIFNIDDDIKRKCDRVKWNGHDTGIRGKSLWEAPIFGVSESRVKSLEMSLGEWEKGMSDKSTERVSISEAVVEHELRADLDRRMRLIRLKTGNYDVTE